MKGLLFLILLFQSSYSLAVDDKYITVKAVLIYKFTQYVTWPKKDRTEFLGEVKNDPKLFKKLNGVFKNKKLKKLPVNLSMSEKKDPKTTLDFVTFANCDSIKESIYSEPGFKSLVIVDGDCLSKSHINLKIKKGKFTFGINLKRLKASNIKISSRLIQLAKEVLR